MDSEILQGFVKQAEEYLPTIRSGILICGQTGSVYGELQTALRQIASIKNAASIMGFDSILKICAEFEVNLEAGGDSKEPLGDQRSRLLLDKLTELEAAIAGVYFTEEDFSDSISKFVEESFEQFQLNEIGDIDIASLDEIEEAEEEFEIDEEMLEIFALEADDLVQNINVNLKTLEKAPNDRKALLEVRRSAHTLKGSAGIVGLKRLSQIAHRIEDLLDFLAEKEIGCSEEIFELLLASTDCFEALARDEKSAALAGKISQIYKNFDVTMARLQTEDEFNSDILQLETETVTPPVQPVVSEAATEENFKGGATQNRSVVRVSLEKLDDLVKIVSGLVVSRSVFERRIAELDRQISELHNSTRRLQRSTSKLEIEFEADMLGGANLYQTSNNQAGQINRFAEGNSNDFDLLELDKYTEFHQTTRELVETTNDTFAINSQLDLIKSNFESLFDNQRRLIEDLQEKLLRLRMVSFNSLSVRLHRTVRVTCDEEEKIADLFIEGERLEVDTQILDCLIEPLLHLLRNAVAHGIEQPEMRRLLGKPERGKITLRVSSEKTHILVAVFDDGRGISAGALREKAVKGNFISSAKAGKLSDEEAFELIFLPGLTTAEQLSQVAGRGVGMNIVKANIARCQGTISISSEAQKGTSFTLRVPMTSAVARVVLVKVDNQSFAFPINLVKHFTEISAESAAEKTGKTMRLGDKNYTVFHLNNLLSASVSPSISDKTHVPVLLLETVENSFALIVDEIIKTEEIVIKQLGAPLQNTSELLGATILSDGSVVPVLDLIYLLQTKQTKTVPAVSKPAEAKTQTIVMIIDDSPSVRHVTSNLVKNAGLLPVIARDGLEALEILQRARELPHVILTDIEMPRMDGYEFLASLKRQETLRKIPVVMITSRTSDKHRRKAIELGAAEYLTKPFDDKFLINKINNLVKSAQEVI